MCHCVWTNMLVLVTTVGTRPCSISSALFTCNVLFYGHHDDAWANISFGNQQLNLSLFSVHLVLSTFSFKKKINNVLTKLVIPASEIKLCCWRKMHFFFGSKFNKNRHIFCIPSRIKMCYEKKACSRRLLLLCCPSAFSPQLLHLRSRRSGCCQHAVVQDHEINPFWTDLGASNWMLGQ